MLLDGVGPEIRFHARPPFPPFVQPLCGGLSSNVKSIVGPGAGGGDGDGMRPESKIATAGEPHGA